MVLNLTLALVLLVVGLISCLIGFIFGSLKTLDYIKECKNKSKWNIFLNSLLLFQEFVSLPILVLISLLVYSVVTTNSLIILIAISFLLPTIFMEKILQGYKSSSASFDILTARFFERSSYILLTFGCIIGIIFTLNRVGLIGR